MVENVKPRFVECCALASKTVLILWFACIGLPAGAIESSEVEARAGLPWTEKFRTNMQPLLDQYNKQKDHKAIAVALGENSRRVAFGRAWGAASQLAAATAALQVCQTDRTNKDISGACEVVISNDAIISLGKSHFDDIDQNAPSNVWRVALSEGELYVVGTVHVLKPTVFPLPRAYDIAYEAADQLALETNVLLMSDPQRIQDLQDLVTTDAKALKKQMPRKLRKALSRFAKRHGGRIETLYGILPIVTDLQIAQIAVLAHGYSGNSGVEMHYSRQATADGKAIVELEDFLQTTRLMTELPLSTQLLALEDTLTNYESFPEQFNQLLETWVDADIEELYTLSMAHFRAAPELEAFGEAFLDGRNVGMMNRIRPLLELEQTTTVMVGAAHLGGPNGLIELLRKEGLNPVQLSVAGEPIAN